MAEKPIPVTVRRVHHQWDLLSKVEVEDSEFLFNSVGWEVLKKIYQVNSCKNRKQRKIKGNRNE